MRINGQRIYLRFLTPDDATPSYLAWMHDPDVIQYLESRWSVQTLDSIRAFIKAMNDSPRDYLFGIFLKETEPRSGQHIGNIKVGGINERHRFGDVGLIIGEKSAWGKGYASEAITLATQYGFDELNLNKLTAGMYEQNVGSYKAFLKAGYREVGVYKQHFFYQGGYMDMYVVEKCRNAE